MSRIFTSDDLTDDEITEKEREIFKSDADDDLNAYLAGDCSAEWLLDRLRYHRAKAKDWATTALCDQKNQEGPEGLDGVA